MTLSRKEEEFRDSSDRVALMILGMHRSGTSAITRVLNLLGGELPWNILPASDGNPDGHWESQSLHDLNQQLLKELGSDWDDWRELDLSTLESNRLHYYQNRITQTISEEYEKASTILIKDPRLCRLLAPYRYALGTLGITPRYVLIHRNPLAVVQSLNKRNDMTPGFADLLWLRHILEAEKETRGEVRYITTYETFLSGWQSCMQEMRHTLGLGWPQLAETAKESISHYLRQELVHHRHTLQEAQSSGLISSWSVRSYAAILDLEKGVNETAATRTLDKIREEFNAASNMIGQASLEEMTRREYRLANTITQLENELSTERNRTREITEMENDLRKIKESSSWRITRPLRALATLIRKGLQTR